MELHGHSMNLETRRNLRLPLMRELEPSVQVILARLGMETPRALTAKSLDQLLLDLSSSEWEVRVGAVRALDLLGLSKKRDVVEHLVKMLHDEVGSVRLAVVHVLGKLGWDASAEALEALIEAFCNSEWFVRAAVVSALSEQGERVPSWFFMHALRDENGFVRAAALRSLGTRGLITLD